MRTLGHREGNHSHWARLEGGREGRGRRDREAGRMGITLGEMPDVGNRCGWMETANHHGMCMYLCNNPAGCRMCTCTPDPKVQ